MIRDCKGLCMQEHDCTVVLAIMHAYSHHGNSI